MYTYRPLSLPEDHPVKNILPISFRKGDGDTQPRDQPENILLWAKNGKANTYGHWLARQIFLTRCVDPTYNVEPVERAWCLNEIPGQVIIKPAKRAIQDANSSQTGLVLWTDGSKLNSGKTGAAVVWKDKRLNVWRKRQRYLGEKKLPDDAELWAIFDALEVAINETDNIKTTPITVFTDSKALTKIQDKIAKSAIKDFCTKEQKSWYGSGHSVVFQ